VTNVTFIYKPLQIQNLKKKWGVHDILYPQSLKKWGRRPRIRVPHLIAPMLRIV